MLFSNYESVSYWLKEHSKVNVNGMDISTKENEIYELNFSSYEFEIITHRIKKPRLFNKQDISPKRRKWLCNGGKYTTIGSDAHTVEVLMSYRLF